MIVAIEAERKKRYWKGSWVVTSEKVQVTEGERSKVIARVAQTSTRNRRRRGSVIVSRPSASVTSKGCRRVTVPLWPSPKRSFSWTSISLKRG
jgi:hypothetical protein